MNRRIFVLVGGMAVLILALVVGYVLLSDSGQDNDATEDTAQTEQRASAETVLQRFFALLQDGGYADTVMLYGGDFTMLREWNPEIDPDDLVALLEAGCTMNGLQCLAIWTVTSSAVIDPDVTRFTLQFANADGSLFSRETATGPESEFVYTVKRVEEQFVVMELPVYME